MKKDKESGQTERENLRELLHAATTNERRPSDWGNSSHQKFERKGVSDCDGVGDGRSSKKGIPNAAEQGQNG